MLQDFVSPFVAILSGARTEASYRYGGAQAYTHPFFDPTMVSRVTESADQASGSSECGGDAVAHVLCDY